MQAPIPVCVILNLRAGGRPGGSLFSSPRNRFPYRLSVGSDSGGHTTLSVWVHLIHTRAKEKRKTRWVSTRETH